MFIFCQITFTIFIHNSILFLRNQLFLFNSHKYSKLIKNIFSDELQASFVPNTIFYGNSSEMDGFKGAASADPWGRPIGKFKKFHL